MSEMVKVVAITKKGDAVKLRRKGQDQDQAKWYNLSDKVQRFSDRFTKGKVLDCKLAKRGSKLYVDFVNMTKSNTNGYTGNRGGGGSSTGNDSIKKSIENQVVIKSTAEIVSGLEGVTLKNVEAVIDKVYQKLSSLTAVEETPTDDTPENNDTDLGDPDSDNDPDPDEDF